MRKNIYYHHKLIIGKRGPGHRRCRPPSRLLQYYVFSFFIYFAAEYLFWLFPCFLSLLYIFIVYLCLLLYIGFFLSLIFKSFILICLQLVYIFDCLLRSGHSEAQHLQLLCIRLNIEIFLNTFTFYIIMYRKGKLKCELASM